MRSDEKFLILTSKPSMVYTQAILKLPSLLVMIYQETPEDQILSAKIDKWDSFILDFSGWYISQTVWIPSSSLEFCKSWEQIKLWSPSSQTTLVNISPSASKKGFARIRWAATLDLPNIVKKNCHSKLPSNFLMSEPMSPWKWDFKGSFFWRYVQQDGWTQCGIQMCEWICKIPYRLGDVPAQETKISAFQRGETTSFINLETWKLVFRGILIYPKTKWNYSNCLKNHELSSWQNTCLGKTLQMKHSVT